MMSLSGNSRWISGLGVALACAGAVAIWQARGEQPAGGGVAIRGVAQQADETAARSPADKPVSYNRDIRPILSDRCFTCHGPDTAARQAELRLDVAEDGEDYFGAMDAIVPGDPQASELINRIESKRSSIVMPPPESHLSLTDDEKQLIRQWVKQGGEYEQHWSFVPLPDLVVVPEVEREDWPRDEMDRFVLARIEQAGLKPNGDAKRERWLRRVTFDLTGLPPTPQEVEAFLDDKTEQAYERVVDRLLASPHYGERMATQWIDLARYADSYGYQSDQLSPTWPWRDWLIGAFNDNLPYDDFVTWQLAGDLLPNATRDQRLATAFNRLHRMTNEGGSISDEWLDEYAADRVHTFGTAFMGMTFECARCHDHRYDPIEQTEYFQLYAFFNSIDEWGMYQFKNEKFVPTPSLMLPSPEQDKQWDRLRHVVDTAQAEYAAAVARQSKEPFDQWLTSNPDPNEQPGLEGHYPFEQLLPDNKLANLADPANPATTSPANTIVQGHTGQGLKFAGDSALNLQNVCGGLQPYDAFSVSFWLKLPKANTTGIIFHRSDGTDVGFNGTDLMVVDGRLRFRMMRFWPGNAMAVRTTEPLPVDEWVQATVTYDASFDASGMVIYINGQPASEMLRDNLFKLPQHRGTGLTFDQRMRTKSLPGAIIDDIRAYNRGLTAIEAKHLYDRTSLAEAIEANDRSALLAYYLSSQDAEVAKAKAALVQAKRELLKFQTGLLEVMVMEELPEPKPAYRLARGAYDAPKNEQTRVYRDTPAALPPFPDAAPQDRLGLAQWLTSPDHPLTARVAVNRLWQICFGKGIVETSDNFGLQGSWPTHPELLNYLAREFVNSSWDTKAMLKRIVLSATYRQDSAGSSESMAQDPDNSLLARGPSRRLSAEMIRDTALAASGLLKDEIGGPPVAPYQPPNLWRESNSMSPAYKQSVGKDLYRRSIYTVWKRTAPMPNMIVFDAPSREVCSAKRSETNTPSQALVLLNDVQFVEACRVQAETLLSELPDASASERIDWMFLRWVGRSPDDVESKLLEEVYQEQRDIFSARPDTVGPFRAAGESAIDESLDAVEVATWTVVAQTILNYDPSTWRR